MLNAEKILKLIDDYKFDDVRKLCLSEIAAQMIRTWLKGEGANG